MVAAEMRAIGAGAGSDLPAWVGCQATEHYNLG
jgi:hypothetical protein